MDLKIIAAGLCFRLADIISPLSQTEREYEPLLEENSTVQLTKR